MKSNRKVRKNDSQLKILMKESSKAHRNVRLPF